MNGHDLEIWINVTGFWVVPVWQKSPRHAPRAQFGEAGLDQGIPCEHFYTADCFLDFSLLCCREYEIAF